MSLQGAATHKKQLFQAGEAGEEGQCVKEVVYSLITAKKGASSQLQLTINSSLKPGCTARSL